MASQEHVLLSTEQYNRLVQRLKDCDTTKSSTEQSIPQSTDPNTEGKLEKDKVTDTYSDTQKTREQNNSQQEPEQSRPKSPADSAPTSQEQAVATTKESWRVRNVQRKEKLTTTDNTSKTTKTRTKKPTTLSKQLIREKLSPPGKRHVQEVPVAHRRKWSKLI